MKRRLFSEDHDIFREAFRKFLAREIIPHHPQWEIDGQVSREAWLKAGQNGFLLPCSDPEYGGGGVDFLYSVIIREECTYAGVSGYWITLHNDIVAPYLDAYATDEQKRRWLPKCASGEAILAVAMTEPDTGSDLSSIRTTAVRDGDEYIINGSKTFISNGLLSDVVIVAAKTDPKAEPPHKGISLIVVERGAPGFERGKKIPKMGLQAQDTAELFFNDCRVPVSNLLGEEGNGFVYLMEKLQQERLCVAIGAQIMAERALDLSLNWCADRKVFGKPLSGFQNTRFKLAEMASEIQIGRVFVDRLIEEHMAGSKIFTESCMAKFWVTEMLQRAVDRGVQFHGGYGYSTEYPIAKLFLDARVETIYAGTSEIMLEIIGRSLKG